MPLRARQVVLRQLGRGHLHQCGDVLHSGLRELLDELREPGLDLEKLQHQREAEPRRPTLVGHEHPVAIHQRPTRQQLFRRPLLSHTRPLSSALQAFTQTAQRGSVAAGNGETYAEEPTGGLLVPWCPR